MVVEREDKLMNLFELALFLFFVYILVYSLISRVCKCFEHCATAKSLGDVCKGSSESPEEIIKKMVAAAEKEN